MSSWKKMVLGIACLLILFQFMNNRTTRAAQQTNPHSVHSHTIPKVDNSKFKCDGRTHCSQMNSCEEAIFFIQNCPNTKMDGNNDGIPCEKQWCGK